MIYVGVDLNFHWPQKISQWMYPCDKISLMRILGPSNGPSIPKLAYLTQINAVELIWPN